MKLSTQLLLKFLSFSLRFHKVPHKMVFKASWIPKPSYLRRHESWILSFHFLPIIINHPLSLKLCLETRPL
jgi:hypothetical protein